MLRYLAVICLVILSCHLGAAKLQITHGDNQRAIKVANGQTTSEHEFPFIVSIQKQLSSGTYEHLCTGSILSSTFVLTAAHCLESSTTVVVVYGTYDNTCTDSNCKYIKVKKQIAHPSYQSGTERNDIAVFELESALPIDDSTVSTVSIDANSIAINDEDSESSRLVLISGWGALNSNLDYPKKLQKASVPIVKMSYCNNLKLDGVEVEQICAGAGNGRDACSGDSGGPLFRKVSGSSKYTQFGVVSAGYATCGATVSRGLYSNTTFYLSFIQNNVPGVSINYDSNTANPGDIGTGTTADASQMGYLLSFIVVLFIISLIY